MTIFFYFFFLSTATIKSVTSVVNNISSFFQCINIKEAVTRMHNAHAALVHTKCGLLKRWSSFEMVSQGRYY